jgi:hypothetical protein
MTESPVPPVLRPVRFEHEPYSTGWWRARLPKGMRAGAAGLLEWSGVRHPGELTEEMLQAYSGPNYGPETAAKLRSWGGLPEPPAEPARSIQAAADLLRRNGWTVEPPEETG